MPEGVWLILEIAWEDPLFVAANIARERAVEVAFAASQGWITTITPDGRGYSRRWHLTIEGLTALNTRGER